MAWELTHGPIEDGSQVLHDCDTSACVNPGHLFLGTHADNMRDKTRKGRQVKGDEVHTSKLNEEQVVAIRERYADGELQRSLATAFGIGPAQLSKIVRGLDWKHVGGPVGSRGREVQTKPGSGGRLSEDSVIEIRARVAGGETQAALAREYGVTRNCVSRIVLRKTWRHL